MCRRSCHGASLLLNVAIQGTRVAAAEEGGYTASAAVIGSTGSPEPYSLPEAPGCPTAAYIGSGPALAMYEPGYVTVMASSYFTAQKVVVTESTYQKLANGSHACGPS